MRKKSCDIDDGAMPTASNIENLTDSFIFIKSCNECVDHVGNMYEVALLVTILENEWSPVV